MSKRKKIFLISLSSFFGIVLIWVLGFIIYASDYYKASSEVYDYHIENNINKESYNDYTVYYGDSYEAAVIFYPGGKVSCSAYIPLMVELAKRDIMGILVSMPFNLAVFGINRADGIKKRFRDINKWYMSGHSLGGAMAASYISNHKNDYDGLILLAAYSEDAVSDLNVLSIYGSNDKVLNKDKYTSNLKNLGKDYVEIIIDGGNHSGFGVYGYQANDGESSLDDLEQIKLTSSYIYEFIYE